MREFFIAGRRIADDEPAYMLAEIGGNHMGSRDEAHALIDMAADCGAHGVKFQRRHNDTLYSRALLDAPYDNPVSFGRTYGEHRAALELPIDAYPALIDHAHRRNLGFVCTAFDNYSVYDLASLPVDAIKIASGGATDGPLIECARRTGLPVLISTGGCRENDIHAAHALAPRALLLHCTASYPADHRELDLAFIQAMRGLFPHTVIGWSSHENGIAMSLLAWAAGARLIEQHITRNHAAKGTDHAFSLEREGLRKLCRDLARAPEAWGDGEKHYYDSERKPIAKMRRRRQPDGSMVITGELDGQA